MTSDKYVKFRFRKFQVYTDARKFRTDIMKITNTFPKSELYSLTNQLLRALNSIILNIAEGADRGTDKDFAHFLNNSHTSLNEVVACLDLALDNRYITYQTHNQTLLEAEKLANQITAFRKSLLDRPTK